MSNQTPSEQLYCQAARFANKKAAGAVYGTLQELIFAAQDDCDLSAYRLHITEGWHVVVVGEKPPDVINLRIEALLTQGTLVNLQSIRPDVVSHLQARRTQATRIAPWVEAHYSTSEE